uniref:NADH-ubiquinone oxidoreductase chain 2 n=1 Tax=Kalasha nativa TaxID=2800228 RepID=A0A7T7BZ35_9HEMI|nr:NADH dehydrogenase subunit 2 [Kalasha nativa]QQK57707.1 NADH dehydrogenase subunit 2 [Kalasha nativa]
MKVNSTLIMLTWTMTIGVMVSMSSNSWVMMWSGIEISMMSFIPMMTINTTLSSESCVKYFIIQSISSMVMTMGILMMATKKTMNYEVILSISLMMKLGATPFHNWVLSVIEGMDYLTLVNLIVTMKLAPLCLLSYLSMNMMLIPSMTMITGSFMGMNQNSIRKLIGCSSIFNLGLVMNITPVNLNWMMYMLMYSLMTTTLVMKLKNMKITYLNQLTMNNYKKMLKLKMWVILLSMGGMPPTLGFTAKLMALETMIQMKMMINSIVMIMTSLIVMYFYMRITSLSLMYSSTSTKNKMFMSNESSIILMMVNLIGLPMLILIKLMP